MPGTTREPTYARALNLVLAEEIEDDPAVKRVSGVSLVVLPGGVEVSDVDSRRSHQHGVELVEGRVAQEAHVH
jgi:hypothetical protein